MDTLCPLALGDDPVPSPGGPGSVLSVGSLVQVLYTGTADTRPLCPASSPELSAGRASLRGPKVSTRKRQARKAGHEAMRTRSQPSAVTGEPGDRAAAPTCHEPRAENKGRSGCSDAIHLGCQAAGRGAAAGRPQHRHANSGEACRCLDLLHSVPKGLGRRGTVDGVHGGCSQLAVRGGSHPGLGGGSPRVGGRAQVSPQGQKWLSCQAERGRRVPPGGGGAVGRGPGQQAGPPPAQRGKARRHGVEDLCLLPEGRGPGAQDPSTIQTGGHPNGGCEAAQGPREPPKDTGRALRAAHEVEAGGDHVGRPPAAGQALAHGHLEEVEGRVQAMLVQLQLAPQVVDLPPP